MFTFSLDDGCYLRLLEEVDAEELYEVIVANRLQLARWMPWAPEQTLDGTLAFIRSVVSSWLRTKGFRP